MRLALFLLFGVGAMMLFAYLKLLPAFVDKRLITIFNRMVVAVTFLLAAVFFSYARVSLPLSDDLRTLMALAGAIGIEILSLIIFFLLRNFWIFKPPRRPGGGLF